MSEATVKWLDKKNYVGIDSTGHGLVISAMGDEGGIGAKPSDLLLLSLAGCTAIDVVGILQKKRQKLTGLEITVIAPQGADPPWAFESFHVHYKVRGRGLSEKAVADAIELSDSKYCSVSATLRPSVAVTTDYEIVEDE
jgi:putative redox protein